MTTQMFIGGGTYMDQVRLERWAAQHVPISVAYNGIGWSLAAYFGLVVPGVDESLDLDPNEVVLMVAEMFSQVARLEQALGAAGVPQHLVDAIRTGAVKA